MAAPQIVYELIIVDKTSMVRIITGPRNSGKSTRFLQLYNEAGGADIGLFSRKRLDANNCVKGYDLILLPAESTIPLARVAGESVCFPKEDQLVQGQFVFSLSAFKLGHTYILNQCSSQYQTQGSSLFRNQSLSSVWIDEVGKLELQGLGYASLLQHLLKRNIDLTLVIRDTYLPDILTMYSIKEKTIHFTSM